MTNPVKAIGPVQHEAVIQQQFTVITIEEELSAHQNKTFFNRPA